MGKLTAFTFITLNGFFKGPGEDTGWHLHGGEEAKFSEQSLERDNILLFGRKTYEMMAAFWPTPMARQSFPMVAEGMNRAEKLVFSRTMSTAEWNNTKVLGHNIIEEAKRLKLAGRKDMTLLGSGSIVTQFADDVLIDEYEIMLDPVVIGRGTPIFEGISRKLELTLTETKVFKSGVVLLRYQPARR